MQVLSDDEISQLLNAISSSNEDKDVEDSKNTDSRRIRIYDFKRPDKFSKLEIRFVSELLSSFASNFAAQICQNYQMIYEPNIVLSSIDVLSWDSYIHSLPKEGFLSYYFDWFDGKVALAFEKISTVCDLYNNTEGKQNGKPYSHTETSQTEVKAELNKFADGILSNGLYILDYDLYKKLPGKPERDEDLESRYLSNPSNFFNVSDSDMMIYATFTIDGLEDLSLAIDARALRNYLNAYNGKEAKSSKLTANSFGNVSVHISALLGQTDKKLEDLVGLGPGSIIELDKVAGEPIDIVAGNKTIAKGEVVVYGEQMAVRIIEVI